MADNDNFIDNLGKVASSEITPEDALDLLSGKDEPVKSTEASEESKNTETKEDEKEENQDKGKETPAKEEKETDKKEDKAEETETETEETEPVVLAKDKTHTLPYSVVEGLRGQIKDLKSKIASLEATGDLDVDLSTPEIPEDDLELLKEAAPETAKAISKLMDERVKLVTELQQLKRDFTEIQAQKEEEALEEVQKAIDSVPALVSIQAKKPELFQEAIDIDEKLKVDPEYADVPLKDRFEKVVEILGLMHPKEELLKTGKEDILAQTEKDEKVSSSKKPKEIKEEGINSLSDLAAGENVEHDPLKAILAKSDLDLIASFEGKSPEEIARMVESLI